MTTGQFPFVYKPTWVANTFIKKGFDEGVKDIDPLKIQKLVYCFHGWHLATKAAPAIGERFEAWPHGPVLSSIYHQFKGFRFQPITKYASDIDPLTGEEKPLVVNGSDQSFYSLFELVWNRYKGLSGPELSALTHADGTPWTYARTNGLQYIPDNLIQSHFVEIGRKSA